MHKVAVLGDYDSIYGFGALGMETYPVKTQEEGIKTLRSLARNEYAVVYVTENMAAMINGEIEKYKEALLPAIILIPGVYGNTGQGIAGVKTSVEKAVGSDILFGDD